MTKFAVVILARLSSRRLPGKILMEIKGRTILEMIIQRLEEVFDRSEIIVATSNGVEDDRLAQYCETADINCYRGSLENVSQRFYDAAESMNSDYAIRINGDNIFVDTKLLKQMKSFASRNQYDFISNVKDRTYPKGMSIEIVRNSFYSKWLQEISKDVLYYEHVTKYLYEKDELGDYFFVYNTDVPSAAGIQLALDTPDDLDIIKKMFQNLGENAMNADLKGILNAWEKITNEF